MDRVPSAVLQKHSFHVFRFECKHFPTPRLFHAALITVHLSPASVSGSTANRLIHCGLSPIIRRPTESRRPILDCLDYYVKPKVMLGVHEGFFFKSGRHLTRLL
jgi:hypothetical protein